MAIMSGMHPWVTELCKALGEVPGLCRSITIHCDVDSAVTATIEKYVDSTSDVLEVIQKVVWVENNFHKQSE
jgi:hypothetical protein